jgi:secreted Zn-dependent insulinase-like peptidase
MNTGTCISLLLASPAAQEKGATASVQASLLAGVLQKALAQSTYAARIAGLSWGLAQHPHGIMLSVYGYSQKVCSMCTIILI